MSIEWFYVSHGKEVGPVSSSVLMQLASVGQIQATTLVWREGFDDWVEAQNIRKLREVIRPADSSPPRQPTRHARSLDAASYGHKFCHSCGSQVNPSAVICLNCGVSLNSKGHRVVSEDRIIASSPPKDPLLMALLSGCCLAGLGQLVLGQTLKAIVILFGTICFSLVTWGIAALITFPLSAVDAYMIASKLKRGEDVGVWECF